MILLYGNFAKDKREKIEAILKEENLPYKNIYDAQRPLLIKDILQLDPAEITPEPTEAQEFVFFDDLPREVFEKVDKKMKEAGAAVRHKAIATPNNVNWKLDDLLSEIEREAAYFAKREQLYDYVVNMDKDRMAKDQRYFELMAMSYKLLQQAEASEEAIDLALELNQKYAQ